jgi:hypothetical protein
MIFLLVPRQMCWENAMQNDLRSCRPCRIRFGRVRVKAAAASLDPPGLPFLRRLMNFIISSEILQRYNESRAARRHIFIDLPIHFYS